jgi:outer membrane protein assembly factor BamB
MHRCRAFLCCGLVFSSLALAVSVAAADNWPRFRGPNGSGVAQDKNIPVQWTAQQGILWKVALPGQGNSSPIIWGDRLFVQAASLDGKDRSLLCLSTRDGKVIWTRTIPAAKAAINSYNSLASSTPATDGQRVYAAMWDGKVILLRAYDFNGNLAWSRDLGGLKTQHGAGASPIVYKDKVIFANDQDGKSTLVAFEAKSGNLLWEVPRPAFRACYAAPFLRQEPGAGVELVLVSTMETTGYDPDTGAKLWDWRWKFHSSSKPLRTVGSPLYTEHTLFSISGDGDGSRHMVAVHLEGQGKATRAQLRWENLKDFPYVPTLLSRGEQVYFVNDRGVAGCYEAKTGKRVWFERLPNATFIASPVLIDGKVYAPSEQGDVFVIAAEPTFKLLARNALGEMVRASPAVADGRLFIRGQNHLFCIGKQ